MQAPPVSAEMSTEPQPKKRRGAPPEGIKKANKARSERATEIRKQTVKMQAEESAEAAVQKVLQALATRAPETESEVERPIARRKRAKAVAKPKQRVVLEVRNDDTTTNSDTDLTQVETPTESEPEERRVRQRAPPRKRDSVRKRKYEGEDYACGFEQQQYVQVPPSRPRF